MRPKVLLTKPLSYYTPSEYMDYVRGLYMVHDQKESKRVQGVSLTVGKRGFRLTVRRECKSFTEQEIYLLCEESGVSVEELTAFLHRTGRTIYNALGVKQDEPVKTKKTNVDDVHGERETSDKNKLLVARSHKRVSKKSKLHSEPKSN